MWLIEKNLNVLMRPISHDCALISCTCTRRRHSRGCISTPHQSIQTEALKGSKEGVVLGRGRFPPGSVALLQAQVFRLDNDTLISQLHLNVAAHLPVGGSDGS